MLAPAIGKLTMVDGSLAPERREPPTVPAEVTRGCRACVIDGMGDHSCGYSPYKGWPERGTWF
jgi:hypothetical protein